MRRYKIKISAGGVLLLAALFFFMDARDFIALLLAAAAHECGHLAALRAAGCRIRGFSADAGGAVIERRGSAGPGWELICLAAGPAAGFLYALAASLAGGALGSGLLLCSGEESRAMGGVHFDTREELISALPEYVRPGDVVLVKASHAMGFEAVTEALKELFS